MSLLHFILLPFMCCFFLFVGAVATLSHCAAVFVCIMWDSLAVNKMYPEVQLKIWIYLSFIHTKYSRTVHFKITTAYESLLIYLFYPRTILFCVFQTTTGTLRFSTRRPPIFTFPPSTESWMRKSPSCLKRRPPLGSFWRIWASRTSSESNSAVSDNWTLFCLIVWKGHFSSYQEIRNWYVNLLLG